MPRGIPGQTIFELVKASPGPMLASLGLATLAGLLGPAFMLATGSLIQAISDSADLLAPLLTLATIFVLTRTVDPIRGQLGAMLWPRIDEALGQRIMRAMTGSHGLSEIESPEVHDRVAQARGAFYGITPGQAAREIGDLWLSRVNSAVSLFIVARWYWWAAAALLGIYLVAFTVSRGTSSTSRKSSSAERRACAARTTCVRSA